MDLCERLVNDIVNNAKSKVYYLGKKKNGAYKYYGIHVKKLKNFVINDEVIVKECKKRYKDIEMCVGKLLIYCAERKNYMPAIYIYTHIVFNKPINIEELKGLLNAR